MKTIQDNRRQGTTVLLLLALVAVLVAAGAASARETKRSKWDDQESTERGRIDTPPMTLVQGVLSGARLGGWTVDGTKVRFEENFTLVDEGSPDATGLPRDGAQVVLMGYQRADAFIAYTGVMMPDAYAAPEPNDTNKDRIEWSATDPTVGRAPSDIPK